MQTKDLSGCASVNPEICKPQPKPRYGPAPSRARLCTKGCQDCSRPLLAFHFRKSTIVVGVVTPCGYALSFILNYKSKQQRSMRTARGARKLLNYNMLLSIPTVRQSSVKRPWHGESSLSYHGHRNNVDVTSALPVQLV